METILVCDDDKQIVEAIDIYLTGEGFHVIKAYDGSEALKLLETNQADLLILDVVMPGMDGFTLLKKLQEEIITQSIPVILITSLSDIQHEQLGLTLGAVDYIAKPFHPMIVKARVHTHIKLYQYRKQVEYQSMTDQLTGVANRRRHDRYSAIRWQEAARLQIPFSVCMFDIDHFKSYNDTFGHPAGDKVITSVAQAAAACLRRTTDFFARYGGEEFVAFLVGDNASKAFSHLKHIRQAVEELHIPHAPSIAQWVTVSIGGVTVIPQLDQSYESYLKIADTMLYDAKRFGRNNVVWSDGKVRQWQEKPIQAN